MSDRHRPHVRLATHEVVNTPAPIGDQDLYAADAALREGLAREGAGWAGAEVAAFARIAGSERVFHLAHQANRHAPELVPFDRHGRRVDEVDYHPAYHELMDLAFAHHLPCFAWRHEGRAGAHVAHAALSYLFNQAEGGATCPIAMTYAAVPVLRRAPALAAEWEPRLLGGRYDPRALPAAEKQGASIGMAMTEKQGGSDVRATSTRALAAGDGTDAYLLTGHKFFCSAPMSDAFLTLAWSEAGLGCYLVPRWRPDGSRNTVHIQRLKDKLGNRSNASAEIEYHAARALPVGPADRGVRTIIDMVQHTRLYCALGSAALMRQALAQALHHAGERRAFQRRLIEQPLMRNVLADLALESEAATALVLRVARAFDARAHDPAARGFARVATALAKYWICKRAPAHVCEAMECLGGSGYVEEAPLARIYREAPVNSIWEGSGNVICLDVQRALAREPEAASALRAELQLARGADVHLDAAIDALAAEMDGCVTEPFLARALAGRLALTLQASLLVRHAPRAVAGAFCASRLAAAWGGTHGNLPRGVAVDALLERAAGGAV